MLDIGTWMLGIGTWILKKLVPGSLRKAWGYFKNKRQDSKNASHNYTKPYKKHHGQLHVSCIGMEAERSLDDIYVTVQCLEKIKATKHRSIEEVEEAFRKSSRRFSTSTSDKRQEGMRVANNEQYLMVLGGPGAGKSTFLRKVGLEALKKENGSFEHESTPVFLELRRFTEDPIDIEAWIINEFKVCGYPDPQRYADDKLKAGELLILFDGLDEVPKPNVKNVINKIRDFVHQYSENRFIVSCREGAYKGSFTDFATVEMADFDDSQIQDYINNWFASASDRKKRTAQQCWEALNASNHQAIKALAQNPLSLALLCQVYEDSQDFPSSETILYGKILNIFLKKWTAEKHVDRDPPMRPYLAIPTVKELLSEIAAENFKADRLVFSEDELTNQIQEFYQRRTDTSLGFDASGILDTLLIDPGLFVEQANGIYSFFHLTFQEYLTANHIVGDTPLIEDLVSNHLHDDRYREIFLFVAGLMSEADGLLLAMEAEAAKCISTDGLKRLFRWAEHITEASNDKIGGGVKTIGGGIKKIKGDIKRKFAIYQCWSLQLLNTIHEAVNNRTREDRNCDPLSDLASDIDRDCDFYDYLQQDLYLDFYLHFYHDLDLVPDQNLYCYLDDYQDLAPDLLLYLDLLGFSSNRYLYFDFYFYMDSNFYVHVPSKIVDQFDKELVDRITLVERIKAAKIFKGVDWQRIVERLKQQQTFIKAARKGEAVEPPQESIHDTWLSVLQIPPKTLTLSSTELQSCVQYLQAIELIIDCKKAAGQVSPDVWNGIEKRFLTSEAAESKA